MAMRSVRSGSRPAVAYPVPVVCVERVQWAQDGVMPVQTDNHQDEGRGLHGEQLQEAQQLTESISSVPLHRHVPHHVQRHHDEGHHQVGR